MSASADPDEFREAVEWYAAKTPMTRDEWDKLADGARKRAFTVAHVANAELVRGIHDSLTRAIKEGQSFDEWKKAAAPEIAAAWGAQGGTSAWHLETIFRTNVQSAYGAGRYEQLTDPDMLLLRPYWMFDAVRDSRTTNECKALDGTVMPADDPWWEGRIPPIHFNCRSNIRSLRRKDAEKQAKFGQDAPEHQGAKGFGGKPMVMESDLDIDLSKFPSAVAPQLGVQLRQDPNKVMPMPPREPPVAIAGPAHGPDAKRGGQWKPGYCKTDPVALDEEPAPGREPPKLPWQVSEELTPRGPIVTPDGVKQPKPHEFALDEYLARQGNRIERLPEGSKKQGEVFPDRKVNGVRVEYRSLLEKSDLNTAQSSFTEAVLGKAAKRQAKLLVVDVTKTMLSYQAVVDALRSIRSEVAFFDAVRVIGSTFDASFDTR